MNPMQKETGTIYRKLTDFKHIKPSDEAVRLTAVSRGSLLTCVKQSGIFNPAGAADQAKYLDEIYQAWVLYAHSTIETGYHSWIASWDAFVDYAKTVAVVEFKCELVDEHNVKHVARFDDEFAPYDLYKINLGNLRIYDNGLVTVSTKNLGHVVTISLGDLQQWIKNVNSIH